MIARLAWRIQSWVWRLPILAVLVLAGCGAHAERRARTALDVAAHAVVAVDVVVAPRYDAAAAEALDASATRAEYDQRMTRWNRTDDAIRAAGSALVAAEAGIQAAHNRHQFRGVVGCVGVALGAMRAALADVGVEPPTNVGVALDAITTIAAPLCSGGAQ